METTCQNPDYYGHGAGATHPLQETIVTMVAQLVMGAYQIGLKMTLWTLGSYFGIAGVLLILGLMSAVRGFEKRLWWCLDPPVRPQCDHDMDRRCRECRNEIPWPLSIAYAMGMLVVVVLATLLAAFLWPLWVPVMVVSSVVWRFRMVMGVVGSTSSNVTRSLARSLVDAELEARRQNRGQYGSWILLYPWFAVSEWITHERQKAAQIHAWTTQTEVAWPSIWAGVFVVARLVMLTPLRILCIPIRAARGAVRAACRKDHSRTDQTNSIRGTVANLQASVAAVHRRVSDTIAHEPGRPGDSVQQGGAGGHHSTASLTPKPAVTSGCL